MELTLVWMYTSVIVGVRGAQTNAGLNVIHML